MKIKNQQDMHQNTTVEQTFGNKIASCTYHEDACIITQPLSENDILHLQELFLTNGWHGLKVKSVDDGRSIISTMLYSLNYYNDIACLAIDEMSVDSRFFDVYAHMIEGGYLEGQYYDIEAFLIEHFYANFLWIEETQELLKAPWYRHFLQAINDLKLDTQIPIIVLLP